ncbi:hypothetical protein PLICRDRAFT_87489 [Plicaturopsis crispa FD-325 SS-3]|nr:hypothetical protein PLICRDRAFT_87489 [Plicaturopsis crispa FD-325 SS-3]
MPISSIKDAIAVDTTDTVTDHCSDRNIPDWQVDRTQLPVEILRMIFFYALPPANFLDPSPQAGGKYSAWCMTLRTKKAFVLVCRTWWPAAMEALYEEVMFRSPWQIAAFVRTLDLSSFDVESSVRRVGFLCALPTGCTSSIIHELSGVLDRCHKLKSLTWDPCYEEETLLRPVGELICPTGLTHLECGEIVDFLDLISALRGVSSNLLSLAFILPRDVQSESHATQIFQVALDRLETLRVRYAQKPIAHAALRLMTSNWTMPCLKRLTVHSSPPYDDDPLQTLWEVMVTFCRAHCQRLEYFRYLPYKVQQYMDFNFQPILDVCPVLKHVVIDLGCYMPIRHPTIQCVDIEVSIEHSDYTRFKYMTFDNALSVENLPSLVSVRLLDQALGHLPEIPYIISPLEGRDEHRESDLEFKYPGVHICYGADKVYRPDIMYLDGEDGAFDGLHARASRLGVRYRPKMWDVEDDDSCWTEGDSASDDEEDGSSSDGESFTRDGER